MVAETLTYSFVSSLKSIFITGTASALHAQSRRRPKIDRILDEVILDVRYHLHLLKFCDFGKSRIGNYPFRSGPAEPDEIFKSQRI
jgi:hypothetical protein